MATIYNTQTLKELQNAGKIQISKDIIPNQLAEKIVPVMEVNPRLLRICNIVRDGAAVNAASANIYTVPTNQDFYLTSCSLSVVKDVTSTSTFSVIGLKINGLSSYPLRLQFLTLTATRADLSINFQFPIKVDRGTNITVENDTTTANVSSRATIQGYLDEQSLA